MERKVRDNIFFAIEISNSILWFSMDSLWMFNHLNFAIYLIIPTALTGIASSFEKPGAANFTISMAVNAWLGMNIFWMLDMMSVSKLFFITGIILGILAIILSKDLKILNRFKRFRK